jgi:hypothetical protein
VPVDGIGLSEGVEDSKHSYDVVHS